MSIERIRSEIESNLKAKVASDPQLHNVYMLIHSDKVDIHWPIAAGNTDGGTANPNQPYHTASVGKAFTAVIVSILAEKGLITFDDPIANYLPTEIRKDLHIWKGKDYTNEIQIKHLLNNTSGLPDFFEEKPKRGKGFLEEILEDSSRYWTPQETIQWSKKHLQPRFDPGKRVHYTDTGYNLLGLLIEKVTTKPYHEVLHDYIFKPLQLNHSYLSQYSKPIMKSEHPVAQLYLDGIKINVENYRSFSSFYSGGQTVSTMEDQLRFMKALVQNQLIKKETLETMQQWSNMRMRFLPFTQKYTGWGHLGASGSYMLYFPNLEVFLIGSFNQTTYQAKGMNYLFFHVLRKLAKAKPR